MSEREEFEKWFNSDIPQFKGELKWRDVNVDPYTAWQACAERKEQQLAKLTGQNAALVAMLEKLKPYIQHSASVDGCIGCNLEDEIKRALSLPQPAALREIEARVLEEAAEYAHTTEIRDYCLEMAAAKREQTT